MSSFRTQGNIIGEYFFINQYVLFRSDRKIYVTSNSVYYQNYQCFIFEGIQGQMWSETIRTSEQIHFRIFPRMLALAERAWHKSSWESEERQSEREKQRKEDWERFTNTLGYRELKRLDKMLIEYRVPVPGVR